MISVIVPAYRAQATIARAVASLRAQTFADWEAFVVADDGADYESVLAQAGITDARLRFDTTGRTGSGCHNARNVGLAAAGGNFIAALDADDVFLPTRLEALRPLALTAGAGVDNERVVADATGMALYTVFPPAAVPAALGITALLDLTVPLFPLVAREHAEPRLAGIELGEDFVANLRLIDRLGAIAVTGESLSEYRVVAGSLCHNDNSAEAFDDAYGDLIARLTNGDRLGLSPANAALARDGISRKRDFNRAFAAARASDPILDFQTFAARQRGAVTPQPTPAADTPRQPPARGG